MRALVVAAAALTAFVCMVPVAKPAASANALRTEIRSTVRTVEQAKTTIRFFQSHAFLLYKKETKRVAWREVAAARGRVRRGRVRLFELRAALQKATSPLSPIAAIRLVFGEYADQAIRVADCETGGTFSVYASNGQYQGLFQMGSWERATFGHGYTPLEQARAAWRYFVASGRDWSPWECRP